MAGWPASPLGDAAVGGATLREQFACDTIVITVQPIGIIPAETFIERLVFALRFTASQTQSAYVWPARHQASDLTDVNLPPLGQRFRLKADFDTSAFSQTNQIILQALKSYGMLLADNGSDWFFSGSPDERWDNDDLHQFQELVHGSDFEAVDSTSLMVDSESGSVARSA